MGNPRKSVDKHSDIGTPVSANSAPGLAAGAMAHCRHLADGGPPMAIQGSCLCGTVRYEIGAPFTAMLSCHCSMCRKHHGAPFATYANTASSGFRWTSGERTGSFRIQYA